MSAAFSPALLTDLYELTMMQAYFREGLSDTAVFSLFVRRLPASRNFLVAVGLDDVLSYLESLRFDDAAIGYLRSLGLFSDDFLRELRQFRFGGDVYAVPEGTPLFANEPILEVVAPIAQAQLVETYVMNQVHLQTLIASKAARVVAAAGGRQVVDFGVRRLHGIDAGIKAARAFHIVGVQATSNVAAGQAYGIRVAGTMAHSYIQAHDDEYGAFRAFAGLYPETVLLVDTYDTINGVSKVVRLARELGDRFRVTAIRLDSGDLRTEAIEARRILNEAGLHRVKIFASGNLDEKVIARLLSDNAPIDGFGVGTEMGVSSDAPTLDIVYKLVEYAGRGRIKLSPGKWVLPGRKQVFRVERDGIADHDVVATHEEELDGRPLLEPVMRSGVRLAAGCPTLDEVRDRCRDEVGRLPRALLGFDSAEPPYPVQVSSRLSAEVDRIRGEASWDRSR